MAIKIRRPAFRRISAVKEFTDRTEPRRAFWDRYMKMLGEGSTIISFYGAGGVGKTALLKKIEDEIKLRNERIGKDCKYVKYDFGMGTDLREVLKAFKFQLADYGCEFPFFDSGNYYYSLKIGQNITPLKAKSLMKNISWIKKINEKLRKADSIAWKTSPFLRIARNFLEVADEVFQATSIPRAITICFSVVDSLLIYYMEHNKILDEDHEEVRNQLNSRRQEKDFTMLYEYLPTLFAIDVADWIKKTGNKLVVILDNYELLISATSSATAEQLKRDLWLRGDDGLIFSIPNTLWTIAGRNKLYWQGELTDELEQHLITALAPKDSDWFLQRAGIVDENLRGKLINLTEGYPIFLDLCVDFYVEHKRRYNAAPSIKEFGEKREEVVGRIFRYLDTTGDDSAKDMLEFLCVLNEWTDEIAIDIGGAVLQNFSRNTYKRVKNFSFIQSERIENENISLTIFRFDNTIQSIIFDTCDKKLIADVKKAAAEHFKQKFANEKTSDLPKIFHLKNFYLTLWAKFIVRLAADADELFKRYKNILRNQVSSLTSNAYFGAAEEILKPFIKKLERLDVADTALFTHFEMDLGWLRRSQGKYNEAYEITNSAYEKRTSLLGEDNIETIEAMHKLAITLSDLGRYNEALYWREKVLTLRENILGEKPPDTIAAMNNLAVSLSTLGHFKDALALREKVLTLRKNILGEKHPDTIAAMNNLALSLSDLNRHDEAVEIQKKALALSKEILGEKHPDTIAAMNNLALSLSDCGIHADATELQKTALALSKEILGEKHPITIATINNLALSLSGLGRYADAAKIQKNALTLSKEILGEEHPTTITAMNNLIALLSTLGRYEEAISIQEQL